MPPPLSRPSPLLVLLVAAFSLAVLAEPAWAMAVTGPEVGWTRLADRALGSAAQLGLVVPVIGVALVGAAIVFSISLPPILDLIVAGAIVTLGVAAFSSVMGAELALALGGLP